MRHTTEIFRFRTAVLSLALLTALSGAAMLSATAQAQAPAAAPAEPVGSIHGHVNNAAGVAVNNGVVKLTDAVAPNPADTKFQYSFNTDENGDYKGTGIKPGTYTLVLFQQDKSIDFVRDQKIVAGADTPINFDMTREEYMKTLTPEQKQAIEDYKKQNAAANQANSQIKNLNALLQQARADIKSGSFDTAIAAMQKAIQAKPDEPLLWDTLGDAQLGAKKYDEAATTYQKAVTLDQASKKPNPQVMAAAENNLGQALANTGKTEDAVAAYEAAAKANPPGAGIYYLNEAIILYRLQKMDESAAAADKAVAADPTKADAYYIKGQALIGKATVDPKTQKITAPEDCIEAYQKYLSLAPTGPHAEEIKQILAGIGEKVNSSYKASKKK